ncbi:DUF1642 domain-containing protein [Streptococcus cristatus]|uniref:DUF1642 domain-containing protein n=1 Tax=Streptococcus cristatus TaxID=45634 RepID=UPI001CBF9FA9|nr:DUF1642 domain-containing protein [Streptococcus cristatus]MBZ2152175.1 DUF1642 domain-containing protein [Streptococcus cristatus]
MNKQELIEKYKNKCLVTTHFESMEMFRELWEDIRQLDEPKKVKIPQFVSVWIDACKEKLAIGLYIAMNPDFLKQWNKSDELISWIRKASNQETFALAWIFGYEVEKEKRYTVVMKTTKQPLYYNVLDKKLFFSMGGLATKFTRKELEEAGFGWVFSCEGVEVEEVEE